MAVTINLLDPSGSLTASTGNPALAGIEVANGVGDPIINAVDVTVTDSQNNEIVNFPNFIVNLGAGDTASNEYSVDEPDIHEIKVDVDGNITTFSDYVVRHTAAKDKTENEKAQNFKGTCSKKKTSTPITSPSGTFVAASGDGGSHTEPIIVNFFQPTIKTANEQTGATKSIIHEVDMPFQYEFTLDFSDEDNFIAVNRKKGCSICCALAFRGRLKIDGKLVRGLNGTDVLPGSQFYLNDFWRNKWLKCSPIKSNFLFVNKKNFTIKDFLKNINFFTRVQSGKVFGTTNEEAIKKFVLSLEIRLYIFLACPGKSLQPIKKVDFTLYYYKKEEWKSPRARIAGPNGARLVGPDGLEPKISSFTIEEFDTVTSNTSVVLEAESKKPIGSSIFAPDPRFNFYITHN